MSISYGVLKWVLSQTQTGYAKFMFTKYDLW